MKTSLKSIGYIHVCRMVRSYTTNYAVGVIVSFDCRRLCNSIRAKMFSSDFFYLAQLLKKNIEIRALFPHGH